MRNCLNDFIKKKSTEFVIKVKFDYLGVKVYRFLEIKVVLN